MFHKFQLSTCIISSRMPLCKHVGANREMAEVLNLTIFVNSFHTFQPRTHILQINAKIFMQIVGIRKNNNILLNYINVVYYVMSKWLKIVECVKGFMDNFMTKTNLFSSFTT